MARSVRNDRPLTTLRRRAQREATEPTPGVGLTLGFVGSGRAARSLARSLARRGHHVVVARRGDSAERMSADLGAPLLSSAATLAAADLSLLAVPDGRLAALVEELAATAPPGGRRVVVHVAGSLGVDVLQPLADRGYAIGAMHPLQVLSGWRIVPGTAFAIEARDDEARAAVARLVSDLGGTEIDLGPGARPAYHAAAVIAANLGMTLLAEAVDLMEQVGVERGQALQGMAGLVRGGLEASLDAGLPAALTGPVTRGDAGTVALHLETLRTDPELLAAYLAVSRLAVRQARKDGRPATGIEAVTDILKENR